MYWLSTQTLSCVSRPVYVEEISGFPFDKVRPILFSGCRHASSFVGPPEVFRGRDRKSNDEVLKGNDTVQTPGTSYNLSLMTSIFIDITHRQLTERIKGKSVKKILLSSKETL